MYASLLARDLALEPAALAVGLVDADQLHVEEQGLVD